MKSVEQQLDDEKKANQAIIDLLDEALLKVGYSDEAISGLTVSGKIDFLVRGAGRQIIQQIGDTECSCGNPSGRVYEATLCWDCDRRR
jgi:hypothetical protein